MSNAEQTSTPERIGKVLAVVGPVVDIGRGIEFGCGSA